MKKTLLMLVTVATAVNVFAQGQINFNTAVPGQVIARVYGPEADPMMQIQGNTATEQPTGSAVYSSSVLVGGSGYSAQLFVGPAGAADDALVGQAPVQAFRDVIGGNPASAGFVQTATVVVDGIADGVNAQVQMRAWDNQGGAVATWADVMADPTVLRGWSESFSLTLGGGLQPAANLVGVTSFNLFAVPEPSTIALGVLGIGALLLFRRRK
jgi:hypothetical protein